MRVYERANIPVMEMRNTKVKINKLLDRYKLKKPKNHTTLMESR